MAVTFIQSLIATLLYAVVTSIVLWFVTILFRLKKQDFKTASGVAGITVGINFILGLIPPILKFSSAMAPIINTIFLVISLILGIFLIIKYYNETLGKSLGIILITALFIEFIGFVSGQLLQLITTIF